jgi:hypothetical protein
MYLLPLYYYVFIIIHHHQPFNVPTAVAQALLIDTHKENGLNVPFEAQMFLR